MERSGRGVLAVWHGLDERGSLGSRGKGGGKVELLALVGLQAQKMYL